VRFFDPAPAWYDWCAARAGDRVVFDVGAGECHVTLELRRRGVKAVGVEPLLHTYYDQATVLRDVNLAASVFPCEAERLPLLRETHEALVLFCRPCHSGFVMRTVRLLHPTAEPVYVGLAENVARDVDLPSYRLTSLGAPRGPEGEYTWGIVRRPAPAPRVRKPRKTKE
jgi:hypothetical protein